MALNQDIQRKAQVQLDNLLNFSRLPTIGDQEALPYILAIVKETLRWHTILPTGSSNRHDLRTPMLIGVFHSLPSSVDYRRRL
jgi:cytochrome P450